METKVCKRCGAEKALPEFNRKSSSAGRYQYYQSVCRVCDNLEKKEINALVRRTCRRLGLQVPSTAARPGDLTCWTGYTKEQRKVWLAEQREIDAKNGIAPLDPPLFVKVPKPKKVPIPQRREVKATVRIDDSATSQALRHNMIIKYGQCQLTGIEAARCDEAHIVSRAQCIQWGKPEWIADEDNVVFIFMALNRAMDHGYFFDTEGRLCPPPGEEYPEWMVRLGVPNGRIDINESRVNYILLAANGE